MSTRSLPYELTGADANRPAPLSPADHELARVDPQPALPPESRRFTADASTVTAAVETLADAFALRPAPGDRWTVEHPALKIRGELCLLPDSLGTRVDLAVRVGDVDASARTLVLMSVGSVFVGGVAMLLTAPLGSIAMSAMNLLGHVLAAAATFLTGLVVRELLSLWRRRQVRRWALAYQRRLWPALEARIGRRIYR